jgi:hypothetical protein
VAPTRDPAVGLSRRRGRLSSHPGCSTTVAIAALRRAQEALMFVIVLLTSLFSSLFGSFSSPVFKERIEDKMQQIETCAQTGCQR